MKIAINPNSRQDPILQDSSIISSKTVKRVADIALPFLNLHTGASRCLSIGLGGARSWVLLCQTKQLLSQQAYSEAASSAAATAATLACTALTIVMPLGGALLSLTIQCGEHVTLIFVHVSNKEYQEGAKELLKTVQTIVFISSIIFGNPALICLSILGQAAQECSTLSHSIQEEEWPEAISQFLLIAIRLLAARPHLSRAKRQYFGKELSQEDALRLLAKAEEMRKAGKSGQINFESLLEEGNFSNQLTGIDYAENRLSHLRFEHIQFKDCGFEQCDIDGSNFEDCGFSRANFSRATLKNTEFERCLFESTKWTHALFERVNLSHCSLNNAIFYASRLDHVRFSHVSLNQAFFNDSSLSDVIWDRSQVQESCFLNATVDKCAFKDSDLTNTVLCEGANRFDMLGKNKQQQTKPVIAITWEFENEKAFAKIIAEKLRKNGAVVFKFQGSPEEIDQELLDQEVKRGLVRIQQEGLQGAKSIGDALLERAESGGQIAKLKELAAKIQRFTDALLVPGGADLEPELYGHEREPFTGTEPSFSKTLLEMGLIREAIAVEDHPVMGICRGSQLINIFFGGTMRQHIDGQWAVLQPLHPVGDNHPFGDKEILGYSAHHQCVDQLGKGLRLLYENNEGVPKGWISEDGKVLGTQFHPELYERYDKYSAYLKAILEKVSLPREKVAMIFGFAKQLRVTSPFLQGLFTRLIDLSVQKPK